MDENLSGRKSVRSRAARDARFVAARMRRRACHSVQSQLLPTAAAAAAPVAVALYIFSLPQLATPQLLGLGFRSVTPLPRGYPQVAELRICGLKLRNAHLCWKPARYEQDIGVRLEWIVDGRHVRCK